MAPAQTRPVTRDQLSRQLIKTGGSPFSLRNFTLSYDGDMFAPLASLNRARREFLVLAEETLATAYRPSLSDVNQAHRRWEDMKPGVHLQTSGPPSPSSSLDLWVYADSPEGVVGGN